MGKIDVITYKHVIRVVKGVCLEYGNKFVVSLIVCFRDMRGQKVIC